MCGKYIFKKLNVFKSDYLNKYVGLWSFNVKMI